MPLLLTISVSNLLVAAFFFVRALKEEEFL